MGARAPGCFRSRFCSCKILSWPESFGSILLELGTCKAGHEELGEGPGPPALGFALSSMACSFDTILLPQSPEFLENPDLGDWTPLKLYPSCRANWYLWVCLKTAIYNLISKLFEGMRVDKDYNKLFYIKEKNFYMKAKLEWAELKQPIRNNFQFLRENYKLKHLWSSVRHPVRHSDSYGKN